MVEFFLWGFYIDDVNANDWAVYFFMPFIGGLTALALWVAFVVFLQYTNKKLSYPTTNSNVKDAPRKIVANY